jgi:hypothetical protein
MENPLPPKYYLSYYEYMLDFIEEKYGKLLSDEEINFIKLFRALPEDARCWFLRFNNRRGLFFKYSGLAYAELSPLKNHIDFLSKQGFIEPLNQNHFESIQDILYIFSKEDLFKLFQISIKKTAKREEIIESILSHPDLFSFFEQVCMTIPVLKVGYKASTDFLQFLFFGNRHMNMTEFVVADLGHVYYPKQELDSLVARFSTRQEALDKWALSEQFLVFEDLKSKLKPIEILDWFNNLNEEFQKVSEIAQSSWQKLILRIAKHLERSSAFEMALEVYRNTITSPSRERQVRILDKLKHKEEALYLAEEIYQTAQNQDEKNFAQFYIEKSSNKKTKKLTTDALLLGETIQVDSSYKYQVEMGALAYFKELGYEGGFSENYTWRMLFGLLFWDIIFDPSKMSFHHPFQRRPSDLHLPDFYLKRKKEIDACLAQITTSEQLLKPIQDTFFKHIGKANPFVVWVDEIYAMVVLMCTELPLKSLKQILLSMAEHIEENTRGFPDLMIWNAQEIQFVEIKGPKDTLSNQQLYNLRLLERVGINCKVLRLKFNNLS